MRVTQVQLVKTLLQPHKIVSSTTKHLKLTVLKQKQIVRKQQLQQHKDVQALPYGYAAAGDHSKPHNFKTVDGITFTLPTERSNITLDLYPKRRITHQEECKQSKQWYTQKSKNWETGNKKERICERTLLTMHPLKKTR